MISDRKDNKFLYNSDSDYYYIIFPKNKNILTQIAIDYDDEITVVGDINTTDIDNYNDISNEAINDFIKDNWEIIMYSNDYYVYQLNDDELTNLKTQNVEEYGYGMDNYAPSANVDITHQQLDYDWKSPKFNMSENNILNSKNMKEKKLKQNTLKEFKSLSEGDYERDKDYESYHTEETKSNWDKAEDALKQKLQREPEPEEVVNYLHDS